MSSVIKTVDYAPMELELLDLLKKHQALDTHQLTDLYYRGKTRPKTAAIVVGGTLKRLINNMAVNHEKFRLERTKPAGRKAAQFRLVKGKSSLSH